MTARTGTPFVSIVVATRNRAALLATSLAALADQRWPKDRLEVIVVDNGSSDATPDVVAQAAACPEGPAVRCVYLKTPGKSGAVNAGFAAVRGDIVALTDDDAQAEPSWIERLVAGITENHADFAAGRITPIWQVPPPPWMSPALYGALGIPDNGLSPEWLSPTGRVMPIGSNAAVTRRALDRVGGLCPTLGKLDGTLRTGEDHEFFLRLLSAGYRGIYEPTAVVRHLVPANRLRPGYFRRWLYQNGRDVAHLEQTYPAPGKRLAGIPRYRWREAAMDACRLISGGLARDQARQVAAVARLAWFGGYLRETAARTSRTHAPRNLVPAR